MADRMQRILAEAIQTKRPVLVNPSDEEIRDAAQQLRDEGRLLCSACRTPIADEQFRSERLNLGPNLQAIAHIHLACMDQWLDQTKH